MTEPMQRPPLTTGTAAVSTTVGTPTSTDTATAQPAITFDRVSVTYGSTVALDEFSLRIRPGETVAMLGPSGSGKSTALAALAGFAQPAGGTIRLAGEDVTALPPAKRGIGVVPQNYALFPHMKVAANVAFGLKAHRVPKSRIGTRVGECLELVGMAKYADRLPRELSGGQQQRVAIARALAISPKVLLLDEPLSALDAQLRQAMVAELSTLKRQLPDTTIVYVTHDQTEALALADRIAILQDARLHALGTPEDLWMAPPTQFTAQFLGGANLLRGVVATTTGTSTTVSIGASIDVSATCVEHIAVGDSVDVAVRAHDIEVVALGTNNSFPARVNDVTWHGTSSRAIIALRDHPDALIDVEIAGRADLEPDRAIGVRFKTPAGVAIAVKPTR